MDRLPVKRALISVSDKRGLADFGRFLADNGVSIVSTGGTRKALEGAGIPVVSASDVTGFPEILNGRVKTLHPKIHAGVLADKDNPQHLEELQKLQIEPFDLVCVNLYDFAGAAAKKLPLKDAVEEIDIGGPCLLRAAAKNFHSVLALCSPEGQKEAMAELEAGGMAASLEFRKKMAALAFEAVSRYDALVSSYIGANRQ